MKKSILIYLPILLICIIILFSCNDNANNPGTSTSADSSTNITSHDTSDVVMGSIPVGSDTHSSDTSKGFENPGSDVKKRRLIKIDKNAATTDSGSYSQTSIERPGFDTVQQRSGILGYSFFRTMKQNETRNIYAYVTINHPQSTVRSILQEINSEDIPPVRENDTASIYTKNILLYKYLDVSLIDPGGQCIITPVHESNRQLIDTVQGNSWQWAVTPKTKEKQVRLILKVNAEKPDGSSNPLGSRNIAIDISLEINFFRSVWTWLYDNPEKLLVLILLPLVAFFGGKFFKRKKIEKTFNNRS